MKKYSLLVCKLLILVVAVYALTFVNSILASILVYLGVTEQYGGLLLLFSSIAVIALFNIGIGVLLCFLVHKLPFFRTGYRVLPRKQIFWVIFGLALGCFAIDISSINLPYVEMEMVLRVPLRFIFQHLPCGWNEVTAVPWIGRAVPNAASCLDCMGVFIGYELFSMFAVKRMQPRKV